MVRDRVTGLVASALAVLALVMVFHPPRLPWRPEFSFHIAAPAFSQLQPGTTVELSGKAVGQLDSLGLRGGLPMLDVHVDGADARLIHANASASIQPHGLLGTQYIEIDGGSGGPLPPGGLIPASRVHVSVTLDEVLNVFQTTELQNLQTTIVELGTASAGRGQDLNAALKALGDASTSLSQVTDTVHSRDTQLASIIDSSQQVSRGLRESPLGAQIKDTSTVLTGLAREDASLGQGVDHTAAVLNDLNVIMAGNTGNLRSTLGKAPQLAAQLRTLLAQGNTLIKGINPALPALMTSVVESESAFGGTDANGHYVRVMSVAGSCILGVNLGCSGGPGQGGPPVTVPPAGSGTGSSSPASGISDRNLMNLLFGSG